MTRAEPAGVDRCGRADRPRLDGATFIVTGGGSCLGRAAARRLHACGARVLIVDTDEDGGRSLAAELGERAAFCRTDVTRAIEAHAAIHAARELFGGLDGLINCAGASAARALADAHPPNDLALFAQIVSVDLIGTFNMMRMAAAAMSQGAPSGGLRRRVIINTAAAALLGSGAAEAAHAAARGGVVAMTLPVARELADRGIRVITIAPARAHVMVESTAARPSFVPALGTPEEYASLVQDVIEDEMLSGESIALDGLSQREVEVLDLVAQGKTNKEIGMILGISARTAQVHISHIYAKLGVGNRAGAVLWLSERQTLRRRHAAALVRDDGLPRLGLEFGAL